jgi:methylthioribose-1-phosphate isomerase
VLAHAHGTPFYVAAPRSTFDTSLASGAEIPIEERDPIEVLKWGSIRMAPEDVPARYPAFDITPNDLITAIMTEKGILYPPYGPGIEALYD